MSETSTVVDIDYSKMEATILCPEKTKSVFTVFKPKDGSAFYRVQTNTGKIPKDLEGHFSTFEKAIDFVTHYLNTTEETFSVRSDRLDKERKERHAAKSATKNDQYVQQGLGN